MTRNEPPDRAARSSARAARWSARGSSRPPRRGRPAEREREEHDVVAAVVVALDVEVPRRFRGGGEDLQGDVALAQARDVDLAARRALGAGPGPTAANRHGGPRPTTSRGGHARGPRRGTAAGCAVTHSRASVRPTRARPTTRAPTAVAAVAAPASPIASAAACAWSPACGRAGRGAGPLRAR